MDRRLLVLALGAFAIGTDSYVVAGILPRVAHSFDVSVAAAGQFVTVYSFAYALMTPIMATLTAHWPRRRALTVGLVVFVASNIVTATQHAFSVALVSRGMAGFGAAMFTPIAGATAAALAAPERRGRALAYVLAGMSAATALGAPLGTLIGSFGDWRLTIWLVVVLGTVATISLLVILPAIAAPPPIGLRERLAPLSDVRVVVTLGTTLLTMFAAYLVYTYISVIDDRATGGDGTRLAILLSTWGIAATIGLIVGGSLTDRVGSRRVINVAVFFFALNFSVMSWANATFAGAIVGLAIWGVCGWGFIVAQQHRLIEITPRLGPLLLALNATCVYAAISSSSAFGAVAIGRLDPHRLPLLSGALGFAGLACAEVAHRLIQNRTLATSADGSSAAQL